MRMHSRRGFLGLLAGVAAGATLDPERLLWRPGAKLISVPAVIHDRDWVKLYVETAMRNALKEFDRYYLDSMYA